MLNRPEKISFLPPEVVARLTLADLQNIRHEIGTHRTTQLYFAWRDWAETNDPATHWKLRSLHRKFKQSRDPLAFPTRVILREKIALENKGILSPNHIKKFKHLETIEGSSVQLRDLVIRVLTTLRGNPVEPIRPEESALLKKAHTSSDEADFQLMLIGDSNSEAENELRAVLGNVTEVDILTSVKNSFSENVEPRETTPIRADLTTAQLLIYEYSDTQIMADEFGSTNEQNYADQAQNLATTLLHSLANMPFDAKINNYQKVLKQVYHLNRKKLK